MKFILRNINHNNPDLINCSFAPFKCSLKIVRISMSRGLSRSIESDVLIFNLNLQA